MNKVIIYSRVSTDKQELAQQERTVQLWLKSHGMTATDEVSEEGLSGGIPYKDRKLGKVVLPMLSEGDTLIVSEISRIGRSMSDINIFVSTELKPRKVRLVVVQMGIDLDCCRMTAMDELILSNFAFAAQLEKELIQNRTQSSLNTKKDQIRKNGYFISKAGKRCTHLGNSKGTDLSAANKASAKARHSDAVNDPNNLQLWEHLQNYVALKLSYTEMADRLNAIHMHTAKGKTFTHDLARTTYHNLKRLYA